MSHVTVCRKCCCVRTTLREFMLLHQLTIHSKCTSVIGIWTRPYSKQALQTVSCSLIKHASHVRESTIPAVPIPGPWKTPNATTVWSHQHRFCVNVWTGIVDDFLLGPYILPERLNANTYLIFLQNVLPELIHPIPLNIRRNMWFQHDWAPFHFGNAVRGHPTATFGAHWIGSRSWNKGNP